MLLKKNRTIGAHGEFLEKDGSPLAFGNVSEFLTKEFIYDLRKQAMICACPIDLIWYIIDFIEKHGKLKRCQNEEGDRLLRIAISNIFCSTFGVDIIQAKFVKDMAVYDESFEKCKDWFSTNLQACIDLYRDEWEKLVIQ